MNLSGLNVQNKIHKNSTLFDNSGYNFYGYSLTSFNIHGQYKAIGFVDRDGFD